MICKYIHTYILQLMEFRLCRVGSSLGVFAGDGCGENLRILRCGSLFPWFKDISLWESNMVIENHLVL